MSTLRTRRPQWDQLCQGIDLIEEAPEKSSQIQWDVVRHTAITPAVAVKTSKEVGVEADAVVPFCLLRTWQIDKKAGTAILASQSVRHGEAGKVSGQVRPSGWFIDKMDDDDNIQLTYIAEHDLVLLRDICLGMSDEMIAEMIAGIVVNWFSRLSAMEHDIE
uniref:START domain-containing protein n=1 Tax=Grammatophora oceanica TaxID=210454 RepID=A0A7S1VU67_9STRA